MECLQESLIGVSKPFKALMSKIPLLSVSVATVLIYGETGTGKDLFARAMHYQSRRRDKPFVPVNCAAIPDQLIENELFGHSKGAFTDAAIEYKGLLAEAEGGTLFLDEVNSLSLSAQGKLLRFLQTRECRPLGSTKARTIDVRIIAATNADLKELVRERLFREDLFHRLNVLSLFIPPLRERPEDIPALAHHFIKVYSAQYAREIQGEASALGKLMTYDWPGNVRELEAVIHRGVVLSSSSLLGPDDLELPETKPQQRPDEQIDHEHFQVAKSKAIEQFEREYLTTVLATYHGNVSHAARSAGTERRAFQRLLRKHGLDRRIFQELK